MQAETDRAREALGYIPHDLPRPEWHKHGRAAIAAGLSVDDVLEWSRGADIARYNLRDAQAVRDVWHRLQGRGA